MWAQLINTALGIWLMVAPDLLAYGESGTDNGHIVGPIIIMFSFVACWEVTRPLRLVNLVSGVWLLVSPWVLDYGQTDMIVNDMVVGALVIGFSFVAGERKASFGGGWSSLWE